MESGIDLRDEVEKYIHRRPPTVTIHEKVDDFFSINRGDIVLLDGRHYVISGTAREKSFGLDDEPKYWVKHAYEVSTGRRKIIKMVFLEQFDLKYGEYTIRCFRSPAKEGRALKLVEGHPCFMQGHTTGAEENSEVRIIDYIKGSDLWGEIEGFGGTHEGYFHKFLPRLFQLILPALDALEFLHSLGIRHGDVRTDHLILDSETCQFRWIDYDYDFVFNEAPFALDLLGIGNMLSELVGQGERTIHTLRYNPSLNDTLLTLEPEDFSITEVGRLMNWKKIYPYIPEKLNRVLMHFSAGSDVFYESVDEIMEDLGEAMTFMPHAIE
jgi:hypothetical protein